MTASSGFSHRLATMADLAELRDLMTMAIRRLVGAYLDAARVEASFEIMGVDTQLIDDGTYFAIECEGRIVGCGGWSRRATMFGGDHSGGRDARLLDPAVEPARVRAMYTHPDFARRGVGRLVLSLCEAAAAREGFRSLELVATVAGEPLYSACGFSVTERIEVPTSKGVTVPCARMVKPLASRGLTIEPASTADRDGVVRLLAAQLSEHKIDTPPASIVAAVDGIMADGRRGLLLAAKEAGTVVGVAYASFTWTLEHGGKSCWLEELYVVPDRRGRGIGDRLLASLLERAKAGGCAAVDLEVDGEHARATNLYARHGFRALDRSRWVRAL